MLLERFEKGVPKWLPPPVRYLSPPPTQHREPTTTIQRTYNNDNPPIKNTQQRTNNREPTQTLKRNTSKTSKTNFQTAYLLPDYGHSSLPANSPTQRTHYAAIQFDINSKVFYQVKELVVDQPRLSRVLIDKTMLA